MLEKPELNEKRLIACLQTDFGLHVTQLTFLPLGADLNTAVYRADTAKGATFVKLRRGDSNPAAVAVPKFLSDTLTQGTAPCTAPFIPPLTTRAGQLWADLDPFKVILYPFVEGRNGFEVNVTDEQRIALGRALKQLHTAQLPPELTQGIPRETFSPQSYSTRWLATVRRFLERIEHETYIDPVAAEAAAFLHSHRTTTLDLVTRAERLARDLQEHPREQVLCHGDIHGWNLLIEPGGALYIVDWDTLIFAPKERDLMFVGVGLGGHGHTPEQETALFYQGYCWGGGAGYSAACPPGPTCPPGPACPPLPNDVDPIALAYYRYERIIEDIAVFCEQLLDSEAGGEDRAQSLIYLKSNFLPQGTIEMAYQSDTTLGQLPLQVVPNPIEGCTQPPNASTP